ncbi:MAG: hypothetical protein IKN54_06130 [Lachnospiraceae bacterium]|nr:hypothetical protein [Lachnospiraceae bacterium]
MYEIIATRDFVDLLKKLPIEYAHILTRSFMSIKEIPYKADNTFLVDLLEQIKNQEVE